MTTNNGKTHRLSTGHRVTVASEDGTSISLTLNGADNRVVKVTLSPDELRDVISTASEVLEHVEGGGA